MSPTYKLLMGIPGTSNALSISQKLGLSSKIIDRAKSKIDNTNIKIEDLLKEIYENKRIIEKEKNAILENSKQAENLKNSLQLEHDKLINEERTIINEAKEKAAHILLDAKEDVDTIIKNIENSRTSKEANEYRKSLNSKIAKASEVLNVPQTDHLNKDSIKINQEVFVPKLNQNGIVISINEADCTVQVGIIKSNFKFEDLSPANVALQKNTDDKLRSIKREFNPISISPEINVIGQNVDEACFVIDKYLDTCSLNGLNAIRIVHGKGTGRLREGIHAFLRTHPHVKSFRIGTFGEGEMGVTVVELK